MCGPGPGALVKTTPANTECQVVPASLRRSRGPFEEFFHAFWYNLASLYAHRNSRMYLKLKSCAPRCLRA